MSDTQGDATGGAVIAWVIIAGADGYTVNPADFSYRDGSFTDPGTVRGPTRAATTSRPAPSTSSPSTTATWRPTR